MPARENQHQHEEQEIPITTSTIVKWSGILLGVVSAVISLVWFVAGIRAEASEQLAPVRSQVQLNSSQIAAHDKAIAELRSKNEQTDRTANEMKSKLDVAVAILERIEKKVDQQPNR